MLSFPISIKNVSMMKTISYGASLLKVQELNKRQVLIFIRQFNYFRWTGTNAIRKSCSTATNYTTICINTVSSSTDGVIVTTCNGSSIKFEKIYTTSIFNYTGARSRNTNETNGV